MSPFVVPAIPRLLNPGCLKTLHSCSLKVKVALICLFIEAYNGKCPYCGVSLEIIGWRQFEIDHFIPKESSRFTTKAQAGKIENLVLACYDCNRSKSDIELADEDYYKVNPDGPDICKSFVRDEDYYIRISENFSADDAVNRFYNQLGLGRQIHRIDYLLMNMRGLRDRVKDKPSLYSERRRGSWCRRSEYTHRYLSRRVPVQIPDRG